MTGPPELPLLTADLPGIGGTIKQRLEDFRVDEVGLYEPSGEGTHVYFRVTKAGIPTPEAVSRLARYLNLRPHDIGIAGLKDARAVATQRMSVEHVPPERLEGFRDRQMSVEVLGLHTNKLRPGHLAANRFTIRIRDVGAEALPAAEAKLAVLTRRGVPNAFGEQRFGARADTADLGRALVAGDLDEFVALYLGRGAPDDPPDCRAAREAFDAGDYDRAMKRWPRHYAAQRRALAAFRKKRRPADAVRATDKRMKRLFVSAFQSEIFNDVLAARLPTLDRVLEGDLAEKADNGAVFAVEDAAAEQPRCERFEISPTGPIVGYRARLAGGEPGRIERAALDRNEIAPEAFRNLGPLRAKGTRRALRFALGDPALTAGADEHGPYVEISFAATSGSYATVAVREITGPAPAAEQHRKESP